MISQTRAAFDIGSSYHKLTVARLDYFSPVPPSPSSPTSTSSTAATASPPCMPLGASGVSEPTPAGPPKVTVLHSSSIRVGLADALSASGTGTGMLPAGVLRESSAAVRELQRRAAAHGAEQTTCIATEVFRAARNGAAHLSKLGMPVTILSQEDEGHLSFDTALAALSYPRNHCSSLVVCDSGGGSTQFSFTTDTGDRAVFGLAFGSGAARTAFEQRGRSVAALASWLDKQVAVKNSEQLRRALARATPRNSIVAIGSVSSMFAIVAGFARQDTFGIHHVQQAISDYAARDATTVMAVVPKLVLLYTLMKRYDIANVSHVKANGSCLGLLASSDERFWPPLHTLPYAYVEQQHSESNDSLLIEGI